MYWYPWAIWTVWPGHCLAGITANWQVPWEASAPTRAGTNFPNRETLLGQCKLHKGWGHDAPICLTPFLLLWAQTTQRGRDAELIWEDPWIMLQSIILEITKGSKGLENKRPVLYQTLIFESLFELRKLEADTMQKSQPGCLSIGLS